MQKQMRKEIRELDKLLRAIEGKEHSLANPVNWYTGEPLVPKTVKNYERELKHLKVKAEEQIELLMGMMDEIKTVYDAPLGEMTRFVRFHDRKHAAANFIMSGFFVVLTGLKPDGNG